jgi:hypothetical protein
MDRETIGSEAADLHIGSRNYVDYHTAGTKTDHLIATVAQWKSLLDYLADNLQSTLGFFEPVSSDRISVPFPVLLVQVFCCSLAGLLGLVSSSRMSILELMFMLPQSAQVVTKDIET